MNSKSVLFIKQIFVDINTHNLLDSIPYSINGVKRLCLHDSLESSLHFMIIQTKSNIVFPIHSHTDSDEVITILNGSLYIDLFSDLSNNLFTTYLLNNKNNFSLLIKKNTAHRVYTLDSDSIHSEVKLGPYNSSQLLFHMD